MNKKIITGIVLIIMAISTALYYYIDDDGIYNVTDIRKNKCNTLKFPSAEEVISYFDKLEERK